MRVVKFLQRLSPFALLIALVLLLEPALQPVQSAAAPRIDGIGLTAQAPFTPTGAKGMTLEPAVQWARHELLWGRLEPQAGRFDWNAADPQRLQQLEQAGVRVVAVLSGGPVYLPHQAGRPVEPQALLERWGAYVQALVDQYGDQIDYWQIGGLMNDRLGWGAVVYPGLMGAQAEPDPILYVRMLQIAAQIIRRHNPLDTVILGSLAGGAEQDCSTNPFFFLSQMHTAGAWGAFDAIGYQPNWAGAPPESVVERGLAHDPASGLCRLDSTARYNLAGEAGALVELAEALGGKPVWVTGLGWDSSSLQMQADLLQVPAPRLQAGYLARMYTALLAIPGVEKVFWEAPLDPGARRTLANLNVILSGSRPLGQSQGQASGGQGVYEYRFWKAGKTIVLLWRAPGNEAPTPVALQGLDIGQLRAYPADTLDLSDETGVEVPVEDGRGVFSFNGQPAILIGSSDNLVSNLIESTRDQVETWLRAQLEQLKTLAYAWLQDSKQQAAIWLKEQLRSWIDMLLSAI